MIEYDEHGAVTVESLRLYTLYRVVFKDDHIRGSFTSQLVGITKLQPTKLVFLNGVVLENWQGCAFEEICDQKEQFERKGSQDVAERLQDET